MARAPHDQDSEPASNPDVAASEAELVNRGRTMRQAMQNAIAEQLRARYDPPLELPPELIELLERL